MYLSKRKTKQNKKPAYIERKCDKWFCSQNTLHSFQTKKTIYQNNLQTNVLQESQTAEYSWGSPNHGKQYFSF